VVADTEPLTRADAATLQLESADQVNVVIATGLLSPGGFVGIDGRLDVAAARAWVTERLASGDPELRRLSQRVVDGTHPSWQAADIDFDHHVRLVEAAPGADGLAELCSRLMTRPLPLTRPLWELLLVPGSSGQPAGFVLRLHHSVADGTGGVRLFQRLVGAFDEPSSPRPPTRPGVGARPSLGLSLVRIFALLSQRTRRTPLLGRISPRREVAFAQVDLAALAAGSRNLGGTINDALLAAVAMGVTSALAERGAPIPDSLRASVPVALADRGNSGNATGVMVVDLPTAPAAVDTRLAAIATQTARAKQQARAQGTFELTRSRWGTRLFWFLARYQRFVALFVSNVKGPAARLTLGGAPIAAIWPVTPIQGNIRLGITALSYHERLYCGIHSDLDGVSAAVIAAALQRALDELAH